MTHNHTHDADLIAAIDRLLDQGEPTGIPALDDLAGTVPRSRPAFEHDLEARLVAQLQTTQQHERKTIMQQVLRFPTDTALPRLRLIRPAYTLIAAALAVALFAVGLFVVSSRPPSGSTPGAMPPAGNPDQPAAQRSPTPTIPPTTIATVTVITATPLSGAPDGAPALLPATAVPGMPTDTYLLYYRVQPGDDCSTVAQQFNVTDPDGFQQLITLNDLGSPCTLPEPGTVIAIPQPHTDIAVTSSPPFTATPVPMDLTALPPTVSPVTLVPGVLATPTPIRDIIVTATPIPFEQSVQAVRPTDLRLVYLAARDLPAGTMLAFPAAGSALDLDVIATYWPADQVPASAVETLNGTVTLVDIPQWQPILADQVGSAGQ